MDKVINKYEIVSGWYVSGSYVEGSTSYPTIEALAEAYTKHKNKEGIKRLCLTCEYSNSLFYKERENIKKKDYEELTNELKKRGIIINHNGYYDHTFYVKYNELIEGMEKDGRDYKEVNKDIVKLRKEYGIE